MGGDDDPNPVVDFGNVREAYKFRSTGDLLHNYLILWACASPRLVAHGEGLLKLSQRLLGARITEFLVRATFFRQFCAGESVFDLGPRLQFLRRSGIGGILDYAAEADLAEDAIAAGAADDAAPARPGSGPAYSPATEKRCDQQAEIFVRCIEAVREVSPDGFAAIKITGLADPQLLQRLSSVLVEIRRFFARMDPDQHGHISRERFKHGCKTFFRQSDEVAERWFGLIDADGNGNLDYVEWTTNLRPEHLQELVRDCLSVGPLSQAALTEQEHELVLALYGRMLRICEAGAQNNVRLLIDAEHSYFQPAIDHIVLDMQRRFNRDSARVFNTYQCYLTDSRDRLLQDHERANREGWRLGAKLVRGAYMVLERQRALADPSIEDPIWPTIEHTHQNYDGCVEYMLENRLPVLVATHNQRSIERTLQLMRKLGVPKRSSGAAPSAAVEGQPPAAEVYFGQLLGMSDHLTFSLGQAGYQAYKYLPYGPVDEVIPYLIRRAQENSGMLSGGAHERRLIGRELRNRLGFSWQ